MRVLPVLLSSLIFLSLGNVQAKAVRADDGKLSVSNSPVTQVKWANGDNNSHIIPGPTYHLMFSNPAKIDARAQNLIHSIHAKDARFRKTDPTQMSPNQLDVDDITVHPQSRSYRFGSRRSSTLSFGSNPSFAGSNVPSRGVGGSSVSPGNSFGISGTVRTPRFGGSSGRVV